MAKIDPQAVMANQGRMESRRSAFDALWGEIAVLVFPRQDLYFGPGLQNNDFNKRRTSEAVMHDPYAAQALEDGVSAFEGFVMPRGERWQKLALGDESLMRKVKNAQWLEKKETQLFALRHDPQSGFQSAIHESAMSLFAFGAQSTWVEPRRSKATGKVIGLSYQSEFIGDIWIESDAEGNVMRIHRRLVMSAEAALIKFGGDLPPKAKAKATSQNDADRQTTLTFLHVIEPNLRMQEGRLDAAGMPWLSGYYCEMDKVVFREGGMRSLGRIVSRLSRAPHSDWGYSQTMAALPMIRQMQQMMIDRTFSAEMALKPALLAQDDELDGAILELRPYGVTWGGLDERGNQNFQQLQMVSDHAPAEQLVQEARAIIDRIFYRDLLQINREYKSHVSAARVMEEVAEKGLLLAPLARQENEWLSRMTMRELALMEELGMLDDMPDEVADYFDEQGQLDIRYDNTLSRMQEAGKSVGYLNLAQQVGLLAQYDNSVVQDFLREMPMSKVLPELARIAGVPASMMATEKDRAAFDKDKAQKEQMQQLLEAAPALSGAARDIAQVAQ